MSRVYSLYALSRRNFPANETFYLQPLKRTYYIINNFESILHCTYKKADRCFINKMRQRSAFSDCNHSFGISPTLENPPMNRTSILSFERMVTCSTTLLIKVSSNSVNSTMSMFIAFRISSSFF